MSVLAKFKSTLHHLPTGTAPGHGFQGLLIDKGERWGGAALVGGLKGYYGERFLLKGHGLDLWGGVGCTVLSIALNVMSGGRSKIADHLERFGDVGMMSAFGALGVACLTDGGERVHGEEAIGGHRLRHSPGRSCSRRTLAACWCACTRSGTSSRSSTS